MEKFRKLNRVIGFQKKEWSFILHFVYITVPVNIVRRTKAPETNMGEYKQVSLTLQMTTVGGWGGGGGGGKFTCFHILSMLLRRLGIVVDCAT